MHESVRMTGGGYMVLSEYSVSHVSVSCYLAGMALLMDGGA